MNFKVKFHKDVPEDIRAKCHEFFQAKVVTEELDGIMVPCTEFFKELMKNGYRAVIHDYGYEIIPLSLFIKNQIETYMQDVPNIKAMLFGHLTRSGLTSSEIEKLAPDLASECESGSTRKQVLIWHDAKKDVPEMNRVVLIKMPGRPWLFHGKGDIKQVVAYLCENHVAGNYSVPYHFEEFGLGKFFYEEVSEWAYLEE